MNKYPMAQPAPVNSTTIPFTLIELHLRHHRQQQRAFLEELQHLLAHLCKAVCPDTRRLREFRDAIAVELKVFPWSRYDRLSLCAALAKLVEDVARSLFVDEKGPAGEHVNFGVGLPTKEDAGRWIDRGPVPLLEEPALKGSLRCHESVSKYVPVGRSFAVQQVLETVESTSSAHRVFNAKCHQDIGDVHSTKRTEPSPPDMEFSFGGIAASESRESYINANSAAPCQRLPRQSRGLPLTTANTVTKTGIKRNITLQCNTLAKKSIKAQPKSSRLVIKFAPKPLPPKIANPIHIHCSDALKDPSCSTYVLRKSSSTGAHFQIILVPLPALPSPPPDLAKIIRQVRSAARICASNAIRLADTGVPDSDIDFEDGPVPNIRIRGFPDAKLNQMDIFYPLSIKWAEREKQRDREIESGMELRQKRSLGAETKTQAIGCETETVQMKMRKRGSTSSTSTRHTKASPGSHHNNEVDDLAAIHTLLGLSRIDLSAFSMEW